MESFEAGEVTRMRSHLGRHAGDSHDGVVPLAGNNTILDSDANEEQDLLHDSSAYSRGATSAILHDHEMPDGLAAAPPERTSGVI